MNVAISNNAAVTLLSKVETETASRRAEAPLKAAPIEATLKILASTVRRRISAHLQHGAPGVPPVW